MKLINSLFLFILLGGLLACSKNDDPADTPDPGGDPGELAALVKEKYIYYTPSETDSGALHRFSYDASNRLIKVRYDILNADGSLRPGSYDSLVYNAGQLVENHAILFDYSLQAFRPDSRRVYRYKNNLVDTVILWVYEPSHQQYGVASRTAYLYVNGKETEQRVYNSSGGQLNRYINTYRNNLLWDQIWFDANDNQLYTYSFHYSNDRLITKKGYENVAGTHYEKENVHYDYRNGLLHKETTVAIPPFAFTFIDSIVYRY